MHRADERHPGWEFAVARRLLHARAPRGDQAPRRLAAAPPVLPVDGVPAARALERTSERPLEVVEAHEARRAASTTTPIASKRTAAASRAVGAPRPATRPPCAAPGVAWRRAATPTGPPRRARPARLDLAEHERRRRRRRGRARRSACGGCARRSRSRAARGARAARSSPRRPRSWRRSRVTAGDARRAPRAMGGADRAGPAQSPTPIFATLREHVRAPSRSRTFAAAIRHTERGLASPAMLARVDHVRDRRPRAAAGHRRGRHPRRAAELHDRRAGRPGRPRGARARARGAPQLGLRVPAQAPDRQPRARGRCARRGPGFDLAHRLSACSPPAASCRPRRSSGIAVFGELSLGGELRPVRGVLAVAEGAARGRPGGARRPARARAARRRSSTASQVARRRGPRRGRGAARAARPSRAPVAPAAGDRRPRPTPRGGPRRRPRPRERRSAR